MVASVTECAMCKTIISKINDRTIDDNIEKAISKVCQYLPSNMEHKVKKYNIYFFCF